MYNVNLKQIVKTAGSLSQTVTLFGNTQSVTEHVIPSAKQKPALFSRVFSSSLSHEVKLNVGTGSFIPSDWTKLIYGYAEEAGIPMWQLDQELTMYLRQLAYNPALWVRLVVGAMGTTSKSIQPHQVTPVPPLQVHSQVIALAPSPHVIFTHLATDYLCSVLGQLGWILHDSPIVYRVRRFELFPTSSSLEKALFVANMSTMFSAMSNVDLRQIKEAVNTGPGKPSGLQVAPIANALASAVTRAVDITETQYNPHSIMTAVIGALVQSWDPETPAAVREGFAVVENSPGFAELRENLSMFLAAQDFIANGGNPSINFTPEVLASYIIPGFNKAMAEHSPFVVRPLADAVSYLGHRAVYDHLKQPTDIVLYEDWVYPSGATAFTPVQHFFAKQRYLVQDNPVSDVLTQSLNAITRVVGMQSIIDSRMAALSNVPESLRARANGAEIACAFPSVAEAEYTTSASANGMAETIAVLKLGRRAALNKAKGEKDPIEFPKMVRRAQAAFDYYSTIATYATSRADNIRIARGGANVETKAASTPMLVLVWGIGTDLVTPISRSAILHGQVATTEPLELIGYAPEQNPVRPLEVPPLNLGSDKESLHMWNWWDSSELLALDVDYKITIRNRAYVIPVQEPQLLGLPVRRDRLRYMIPAIAHAVTALWHTWLVEDATATEKLYKAEKAKKLPDELLVTAYRTRTLQIAQRILMQIESVGTNGVGSNFRSYVYSALATEMYNQGAIDDYQDIQVGIHSRRISVFAGLVSIQMLGLLSDTEISNLQKYLANSDAIAMTIGLNH